MSVLVDTSVWIEYFRGTSYTETLDFLIEENLVVTNQLILSEILPPLYVRDQKNLIGLLSEVKQFPVKIVWNEIIQIRVSLLKNGFNGIGIPDLVIAQNAIQGGLRLLTADKHFKLIASHIPLAIYQE